MSRAAGKKAGTREARLEARVHTVLLSVVAGEPVICVESDEASGVDKLPAARYEPGRHRTIEEPLIKGLLPGLKVDTSVVSLLDCRVSAADDPAALQILEVTYLCLVRPLDTGEIPRATPAARRSRRPFRWQSLYMKLPWEDWRHGRPSLLDAVILPRLTRDAVVQDSGRGGRKKRSAAQLIRTKIDTLFAKSDADWDTTRATERYDLLQSTGLLPDDSKRNDHLVQQDWDPRLGAVMASGDRRRLALALTHLRTAVRERPDVEPLMPAEFTLFELQRCVEAVLGPALHKQNFRRQLETQRLLEPLGRYKSKTGGRPAQLYRFA